MAQEQPFAVKKVALWLATLIPAAVFVLAGATKLLGQAPHPEMFKGWGYPLWFMYVIGAVELTGAFLLVVRRYATLGAALLAAVMLGALATHVRAGELGGMLFFPALLLLLVSAVGYARREELELPGKPHKPARLMR